MKAPFSSTLGVLPGVAPTPVVVQPVYSLPVPQSLTPFVPAASRCRLMLHPWCNILKAKKKSRARWNRGEKLYTPMVPFLG